MVEGDLWCHAHTDLTDFYRGALTLRQVWVRFSALPAEANIWAALRSEMEQSEDARKARDVADAVAMIRGMGGGPRA